MVADFVAHYEAGAPQPWTIPADERDFMDGLLGGIVAFTIDVERLEATWKLNQNHPPERRMRVIAALRASGRPNEVEVADLMQRLPRGIAGSSAGNSTASRRTGASDDGTDHAAAPGPDPRVRSWDVPPSGAPPTRAGARNPPPCGIPRRAAHPDLPHSSSSNAASLRTVLWLRIVTC